MKKKIIIIIMNVSLGLLSPLFLLPLFSLRACHEISIPAPESEKKNRKHNSLLGYVLRVMAMNWTESIE